MNDFELGWVCGFLEGEACFSCYPYKTKERHNDYTILIRAIQVDRTVLEKVLRLTGVGKIREHKIYNKVSKQPQFEWCVSRRQELRSFLPLVRSHLSLRRQEKIDGMLKVLSGLVA